VTSDQRPVTFSVEPFPYVVKLIHVEIVQSEVLPFQFLHVKTVETGIFQEVLAQRDVFLQDNGGQKGMDIDRFLFDGQNYFIE